MSARDMVSQWRRSVKQLLPRLHGHLLNALSLLSMAMVLAGHCHSGRVAAHACSAALPTSRQRRWERLLSNPRLKVTQAMVQLASGLLAPLTLIGQRPLVLILDETPNGNRLKCLKLSVGYRKRAIPLAWVCYPPDDPPEPMPQLIRRLLGKVAGCIPAGCPVTLLADRGLAWPQVLDCCEELGWHYVLRLQSQTKVRPIDGNGGSDEKHAWELARFRGHRWMGRALVFKKAGWREANVVATWEPCCRERWLLVTDLPASFARCRGYCKRVWCEQLHRDEKSGGFNWGRSLVRDPVHADRLLLVMALATLLCLSLGTDAIKRGLRKTLEPARRRLLSVFQLGLRRIKDAWIQGTCLPIGIHLHPS